MPDIAGLVKGGTQAALGIIQNIQANKLKKNADSAAPPLVDPNQAAFLSELNQKRASLDSGTAFAAGINNINATGAGTNNALVRAGGGDVGGTIQSLLESERATNDSKNQLMGQGQHEQDFNNTMYGDLLNKVSARKMQLQLQKSQQLRAEWAQKQQGANQNTMAGFTNLAGSLMPSTGGDSASSGIGGTGNTPSPDLGIGGTSSEAGQSGIDSAPKAEGGNMQAGLDMLNGLGGGGTGGMSVPGL